MKSILILIFILATHNLWAREMLTNSQKLIVISEIDSICGDTWCAGDYNYHFSRIKCETKTNSCELNYELLIWNQVDVKLSLSCVIRPVKAFSDLVIKSKNYHALSDEFYSKLTDCFQKNIADYGRELK